MPHEQANSIIKSGEGYTVEFKTSKIIAQQGDELILKIKQEQGLLKWE